MKTSKNIIILDNGSTKQIIGFTDSVTECECCGKKDLKGTYCLDIDGVELYYGSVCAFKSHGVTMDAQKEAKVIFTKRVKATEKLKMMEVEHNGTEHSLVKMFRFVEAKGLDLMAFINKYGKKYDETDFYTAYSIGHVIKCINK